MDFWWEIYQLTRTGKSGILSARMHVPLGQTVLAMISQAEWPKSPLPVNSGQFKQIHPIMKKHWFVKMA
jgi:hypothetical protein